MVNDENHTASSGTPPVADLAEPVVPSSVESRCKRFFVVFGRGVFWAVVLGCLACLCGLYDAATSATGIASLLILAATTVNLIVLFWHYQRSAALVNYELGASAVWIGYFPGSVSLSSFIDGAWFGLILLLWIASASIGGPIVASQHERTPYSAIARTVRAFALIVLVVNCRQAFDNFDPAIVAEYGDRKRQTLLSNAGIVRNRLKIDAARQNANAFLATVREFGTFDKYIWSFVGQRPMQNAWKSMQELPARTPESDAMSDDLKRRGFKFVGSTICYAFMQAVGTVNDHAVDCFRHRELARTRHGKKGR
jgi:DNA-3-methyladenine glycosylase I